MFPWLQSVYKETLFLNVNQLNLQELLEAKSRLGSSGLSLLTQLVPACSISSRSIVSSQSEIQNLLSLD